MRWLSEELGGGRAGRREARPRPQGWRKRSAAREPERPLSLGGKRLRNEYPCGGTLRWPAFQLRRPAADRWLAG